MFFSGEHGIKRLPMKIKNFYFSSNGLYQVKMFFIWRKRPILLTIGYEFFKSFKLIHF